MPKKILVLEDDPYVADTLKLQLEARGFEVDTASDGLDGLARVRAGAPDLVLLEVVLPKLDGYHVCRLLKFDEHYQHIPLFILTARQRDSDRQIAEAVGADEYLTKPPDLDDLMGRIEQYLGESE